MWKHSLLTLCLLLSAGVEASHHVRPPHLAHRALVTPHVQPGRVLLKPPATAAPSSCLTSYKEPNDDDGKSTKVAPILKYTTGTTILTSAKGAPTSFPQAVVINSVKIQGTFQGQNSPFLPAVPYIPTANTPASSYSELLNQVFWFYEQQRSGLLPLPKRIDWRNNSALHDGIDNKIDLTGGYFDAGQSYSVVSGSKVVKKF